MLNCGECREIRDCCTLRVNDREVFSLINNFVGGCLLLYYKYINFAVQIITIWT